MPKSFKENDLIINEIGNFEKEHKIDEETEKPNSNGPPISHLQFNQERPPSAKSSDQMIRGEFRGNNRGIDYTNINPKSNKVISLPNDIPKINANKVPITTEARQIKVNNYANPPVNANNPPLSLLSSMPKNFSEIEEKEQLYENSQKLKQAMNQLINENTKLKTLIQNNESELVKKDKIINELYMQLSTGVSTNPKLVNQLKTNTHTVMALKRQLKDLKAISKEKSDKIAEISKNIKQFKIQDLESQSQIVSDECVKLRQLLDELIKQQNSGYGTEITEAEEKVYEQSKSIKKLTAEKDKLEKIYLEKEDELNRVKSEVQELETKLNKLSRANKELNRAKKENTEIKKEIKRLKELQENKPKTAADTVLII